MGEENDDARKAREVALAGRLVAATGITTSQATDLISVLGSDWSSLVREATNLKRSL